MKIALFLDFVDERTGPLYAQSVVKRIFDEGHHVAIFGKCLQARMPFTFSVASLVTLKTVCSAARQTPRLYKSYPQRICIKMQSSYRFPEYSLELREFRLVQFYLSACQKRSK